jgi:DNA-binding NtrC family response regulator
VILITAFGGSRVAEEARRLGAYRYLEKPFQLAAILQAVREAEGDPMPVRDDAGDGAGGVPP